MRIFDDVLRADRERRAGLIVELGLDPATVIDGGVEWSAADPHAITVRHIDDEHRRWTERVPIPPGWWLRWCEPIPEREPERVYLRTDDGYREVSRLAPGDVLVINATEYVVGEVQPTAADRTLPRFVVNVEHEHRWVIDQDLASTTVTRRCACGAEEIEAGDDADAG